MATKTIHIGISEATKSAAEMREGDYAGMKLAAGFWSVTSEYRLPYDDGHYIFHTQSEMPLVSLTGLDGAKTVARWSAKFLPKLGDLVRVAMNGLGIGMVVGYFANYGDTAKTILYAGVIVRPDVGSRPDWHIRQNAERGEFRVDYHVFGAEIKEL